MPRERRASTIAPHAADGPAFEQVAMLCQGDELYGIGTIQKLYAQGAAGMAFVCFSSGPLWDWLERGGYRRFRVDGLSSLRAGTSSAGFLARVPRAIVAARRTAARMRPLLEREGIRIVHTQWLPQQLIAGCLRRHGYLSVWQINNNTSRTRMLGLGLRLNHALARWGADLLLPASDYIAANWRGSGVPIRTIRNAAVPLFPAPSILAPGPVRCVVAGRLEESKGHHLAVGAVLEARRRGLDVRLDAFGGPLDGNAYAEDLRRRAAAADGAEAVRFLGFRPELRRHHQEYHLGMQCRIDPEPCSLWVCETLVDGLPLLAAANGGTPELVADGRTGLLFKSGDQEDLTLKLLRLASDPSALALMRTSAFERGRAEFTADRMMRETLAAYAAIVAHPSSRGT